MKQLARATSGVAPLALILGLVGGVAGTAGAQVRGETPPANGMPLPALLTEVQTRENVAWFDEINWDDDGYWEIEFGRQGGGKVEIRVDPITGKTLDR